MYALPWVSFRVNFDRRDVVEASRKGNPDSTKKTPTIIRGKFIAVLPIC